MSCTTQKSLCISHAQCRSAVGEPARDLNHIWYCKACVFLPVCAKTTFRDSYCKCMFGHMQSICVRFAITCLCIVFVCFFTCIISGKDLHAPQAEFGNKKVMRAELEQSDFLSPFLCSKQPFPVPRVPLPATCTNIYIYV